MLLQDEKVFIELITKIPMAVAMFDEQLHYIAASKKWLTDYGLEESIIGRSHYEVFENIPQKWKDIHQQVLKSGIAQSCEDDEFLDNNGNTQFLHWEVIPWLNQTGHVGGLIFLTRDRTTELRSIQQLEQAQKLAALGYWDFNLSDNSISWSKQMFEFFPEKIEKGEPDFERHKSTIHPDDREMWESTVMHALETGQSYSIKFRAIHPDKIVWVEAKGQVKRNVNNEIVGIYGTCQNITESESIKSELFRLNEELTEFNYRASHDLKSPITSTLGLINLIKEDLNELTKEDIFSYILDIEKLNLRLIDSISSILNISKIDRQKKSYEPISIDEIKSNINDKYSLLMNQNRINFIFNSEFTHLESDRILLFNILENLISNSIKYSDKTKESWIKLNINRKKDHISIEVEDNGIGIKKNNLDKVFTMFQRFENSQEGTGLGLYMVKNQVEKLNGSISFKSDEGEGTTFKILFPIQTV